MDYDAKRKMARSYHTNMCRKPRRGGHAISNRQTIGARCPERKGNRESVRGENGMQKQQGHRTHITERSSDRTWERGCMEETARGGTRDLKQEINPRLGRD